MTVTRLDTQIGYFNALRDRLLAAHPDLDEETLADTLEGATDMHEAIAALVRSALDDEDLLVGLKARIGALRDRLDRIGRRAAAKRAAARSAMEQTGVKTITEPDFTASLRAGQPRLQITDETLVPEWFFIPQPAKLDRTRLRDALKAGTAITGAELSNAEPVLSVRVA